MTSLPLIVTAFYDIGRGQWQHYQRSSERYFACFERLSLLENDIVVFSQPQFRERFEALQRHKPNLHVVYDDVFVAHAELLERIRHIQQDPAFRAGIGPIESPEYNSAEYVLVNYLKSEFCCQALAQYSQACIAWIDFGYLRKPRQLPRTRRWESPWATSGLHFFGLRPVEEAQDLLQIIQTNTVYIQGCHLIGQREDWPFLREAMSAALNSLLEQGWVDDDQTLLLMAAQAHPDRITVHPNPPDERLGWFNVFRRFNAAERRAGWMDHLRLQLILLGRTLGKRLGR